jgi:4a-hydroxytetrahydrobiopterin dehydratase
MNELILKKCLPCKGNVPPLKGEEITNLLAKLGSGWSVLNERRLQKKYDFEDFAQALEFTSRVGGVAEEEGHHPDIYLTWGMVNLSIWTHKIDGLTESDFILAAKADAVFDS